MAFQDFAQSRDVGGRAQEWADVMMFGPGPSRDITNVTVPYCLRFGIRGVGMVLRGGQDFIVLLLPLRPDEPERRLDETPLLDPGTDAAAEAAVKQTLGDRFGDVKLLPIPELTRKAKAGTAVYGALQGTAGPEAKWASNHTGFLTAGHVAVGTKQVDDVAGNPLGTTICTFDPGTVSSGTRPNVDVALIEVAAGAVTTRFPQGTPLKGSAGIDLYLGTGTAASTVLGMIAWYLWPAVGGTYVDLYMTNAACTVPGDSGAVVTASGSTDAVGMVVGGTTTFTSYIQDIGRQITTLKTVAGLQTLSL
jgi:hypothetical protein